MMTVSEPEPVSEGISPSKLMPSPITPIRSETNMETTAQIEAILLESFSCFSSFIAMKRRRMCGIPK